MHWQGFGVTDHQCRSSGSRQANNTVMSSLHKTAIGRGACAGAWVMALAMLTPVHAQVLGTHPAPAGPPLVATPAVAGQPAAGNPAKPAVPVTTPLTAFSCSAPAEF